MKNDMRNNWFKSFYETLIEMSNLLNKQDTSGKFKIVKDLIILIVVTCFLKIPFIFIRDLGDNIVGAVFPDSEMVFVILGLSIELIYVIVALWFFDRTLKRYIENEKK